ncbi:pantetheine-phosphate adenylyltransferase [Rhodoferax sp. AJA081-3]|uniref:pantetheine-phosphate adenylyltransferase n=1 Tax=Rhodoferax sp. AJA081-3 TaxID=2752316 RepID=UPI001ADF5481|nr:pantetheine-phosphate adenylyltransferase [Rhodoferax sp. AJA081-3]QTN28153.1 pantetheine-phosphate adenylyltransferase [Rhodoferax sp. AJA081-3]
MKRIAFSGTLDPITNGHLWVIGEARALADEVVVFISENPFKKPLFPAAQRQTIVAQSLAQRGWSNVRVEIVRGDYTARAAKRQGIDYLIRGIRNTTDFDYENLLQQANVDVVEGAKTLFVMPPRDLGSVSSSFVRGLQGPVGWHWSMKKFVPGPAYEAWIVGWLRKEWEQLWNYAALDGAALANADHWFAHLTGDKAYGAPHRSYHNLDHLVHGLTELTVWAANTDTGAPATTALKAAFWFHDAVYDVPKKGISNEEASAQLWLAAGLPSANPGEVADLIRMTDHAQQQTLDHPHKQVLLGADLAILGQSEAIYTTYTQAVRSEYAWVDEAAYRAGRKAVLQHFLAEAKAGALYPNPYFQSLYGAMAICNLEREIAGL